MFNLPRRRLGQPPLRQRPRFDASLHDTVTVRRPSQLKRAELEIHQGYLLVHSSAPLGACRTQGPVEELRVRIPHQTVPLQASGRNAKKIQVVEAQSPPVHILSCTYLSYTLRRHAALELTAGVRLLWGKI